MYKQKWRISQKMQSELDDYELHIDSDLDVREKNGKLDLKNAKSIFWISTPDDRSVGIFPIAVSPEFHTLIELEAWWEQHGAKIIALEDLIFNNIITYKEYEKKLVEILKGR